MAAINDKLEQQNAQTRELTDDELNQATGGEWTAGAFYNEVNGTNLYDPKWLDTNGQENTPQELGVIIT